MSDAGVLVEPPARTGASGRRSLRLARRHKLLPTGRALCVVVGVVALLADLIQIAPPERMRMRDAFAAPRPDHPFGADNLGRDVMSRVAHGARLSLLIGLATVGLTAVAGTALGCVSGYFRRWDEPVMRAMDALMFVAINLAVDVLYAWLDPRIRYE